MADGSGRAAVGICAVERAARILAASGGTGSFLKCQVDQVGAVQRELPGEVVGMGVVRDGMVRPSATTNAGLDRLFRPPVRLSKYKADATRQRVGRGFLDASTRARATANSADQWRRANRPGQ